MNLFGMRLARSSQPALDPPISSSEEHWWRSIRPRYYRQCLLQFGVPYFVVSTISSGIARPHDLLDDLLVVPFCALLALGASSLQARIAEKKQKQQEIRWKRIRDALREKSADPPPPESPVNRRRYRRSR